MQPDDKKILDRAVPAAVLFLAWFVLVLMDKTEVAPFIVYVQAALVGLGVYHTTKSTPGDKP